MKAIASELGISLGGVRVLLEDVLVNLTPIQDSHMDETQLIAHLRTIHKFRRWQFRRWRRRGEDLGQLRRLHRLNHAFHRRLDEPKPPLLVDLR